MNLTRLVRAEFFRLRTTSTLWVFAGATLLSTVIMLVIDCVNANSLLKSFDEYVKLESHGHGGQVPTEWLNHMRDEWQLGHSAVTQAVTIYTAVAAAFLAWLLATVVSVVTGAIFLQHAGYGTQLGNGSVLRAIGLNLAAYAIWAVFGVGFGALVRNQLGATVSATVLYLVGATAAAGVFGLVYTCLLPKSWVLATQVVVPSVASAVMISPTKTFDQSPPQWVGAAVLIGYGILAGMIGTRILRRRDIA